jgi:hypothetical protein
MAQIALLHELQQDRKKALKTGDISQEDYDFFEQQLNNKLAHLHLTT